MQNLGMKYQYTYEELWQPKNMPVVFRMYQLNLDGRIPQAGVIPMLPPIEIPTLLFWENGNTWYGSKGQARFFIQPVTHEAAPDTPDAPSHTTLDIEFWKGPLTKALSHICSTASFPLSGEGLEQTVQWLEEQAAIVNEE